MDLPDSATIADAMTFVTNIWNALPLFGTILSIALVFKIGPKVVRVLRGAV